MPSFKRILVPVDLSDGSRAALEHAVTVARAFEAHIDVLHTWSGAVPTLPAGDDAASPLEDLDAKKELDAFLDGLDLGGVRITHRVEYGSPADVIVAASPRYDLIVMGTHGRTGLARLVLGSVAARVVRLALCPVLTVRADRVDVEVGADALAELKRHPEEKIVYAVFQSSEELKGAVSKLVEAGLSIDDVSVLMNEDTHEKDFKSLEKTEALRGAATGGVFGGTLGGILGGLTTLGAIGTGGIGLMVMGPALAFAAAGGLFGGLVGFGVPREEALRLQNELHEGHSLMAVHLHDPAQIKVAEKVLRELKGDSVEVSG